MGSYGFHQECLGAIAFSLSLSPGFIFSVIWKRVGMDGYGTSASLFLLFFCFFLTPPKSQTNKQAGMACI